MQTYLNDVTSKAKLPSGQSMRAGNQGHSEAASGADGGVAAHFE